MNTVNVIGCGRVGRTLARLLREHGTSRIQDLAGRDEARVRDAAAFIGRGRAVAAIGEMRPADIWMITVPDTQIAHVAGELAAVAFPPSIAFHCSGFFSAATLTPLDRAGWKLASMHPALTFPDAQTAVAQFAGTPCGVEGDELALEVLQPMFTAIGARCFPLASQCKALYHAAAVFASNFSVVVQVIAREAWAASGVPDEVARGIHASLARAANENVLRLGAAAITGPAARGDTHVVEQEIAEVSRWHPEAGAVYRDLSALARRLAERGSTLAPADHLRAG